jgi:alkylation response protein AidB-like acyl-CoA dehydrogenase
MATPRKKTEATSSRIAARPQAERRVEVVAAKVTAEPSYQDVSRRAFEIWERNGRMPGRDVENWLQAEAELRGSP